MKKMLFLFVLMNANLVFAGDGVNYFPKEMEFCASCVMKLPKHLIKSEYCSKEENKELQLCKGEDNENEEILKLDVYADCKMKSYNAVLEKFKKRNIKIEEVVSEDEAYNESKESSMYDSNETYKYTMCLTARYGKYYVYTGAREITEEDRKRERKMAEREAEMQKQKWEKQKEKRKARLMQKINRIENNEDAEDEEVEES